MIQDSCSVRQVVSYLSLLWCGSKIPDNRLAGVCDFPRNAELR